jgi:hypothetical protein
LSGELAIPIAVVGLPQRKIARKPALSQGFQAPKTDRDDAPAHESPLSIVP